MAGVSNGTDHYSSSFISISYDIKNNFPELWNSLPDACVDAMKLSATQALDQAYNVTPYLPDDPRTSEHLRDSTFIQVYRNGSHGGTVYVQWRARNPETGYHYGINQEFGDNMTQGVTYSNYSTPGTGPGFMELTWSVIEQTVPYYLEQDIQNAIEESSV